MSLPTEIIDLILLDSITDYELLRRSSMLNRKYKELTSSKRIKFLSKEVLQNGETNCDGRMLVKMMAHRSETTQNELLPVGECVFYAMFVLCKNHYAVTKLITVGDKFVRVDKIPLERARDEQLHHKVASTVRARSVFTVCNLLALPNNIKYLCDEYHVRSANIYKECLMRVHITLWIRLTPYVYAQYVYYCLDDEQYCERLSKVKIILNNMIKTWPFMSDLLNDDDVRLFDAEMSRLVDVIYGE